MTGPHFKSEKLLSSILVISTHAEASDTIRSVFESGYRFDQVSSYTSGLVMLKKNRYDLVFVDIDFFLESMSETGGSTDPVRQIKGFYPTIEIVVMLPPQLIRKAIHFVKTGVSDYLTYPIDPVELKLVSETIEQRVMQQSELDYLRDQFWKTELIQEIRTENPLMKDVFKKIRSVAQTKTTILLTGETGTGKGILAGVIHQHSQRKDEQFISLHCGAIPDTLLESELFGHEKGAFTGAFRTKMGKFEIAKGGTIFLDEIGTISPAAQVKLLQVLQDGTFSRVGSEETIRSDARVIAATNSDLKTMCEEGSFRKDLFYRLNVFPIEIPPMRDRIEDLTYLVGLFLDRLNKELQKEILNVHPQVIEALKNYDWPGNIRELENLIERAYILENSDTLTPESFPVELLQTHSTTAIMPVNTHVTLGQARKHAVENFERQYIKEILTRNRGRINLSAAEAGISTRQFHKLMTRYGIRKEDFKHA